jgi:hypothetical protein
VSGDALKNPAELPARLGLAGARRLLLVDAPAPLADLLLAARPRDSETVRVTAEALSGVKDSFGAILLWREDRVGSRSVVESAVRRLEPEGVLWAVIAMKKVRGPRTPAAHRLELSDLVKGLEKHGMSPDKEVRMTSWHVAYRFAKGPASYSR